MKYPNLDLSSPIFLTGMPRSGTTWLSQMIEAHPEVLVRFSPNYSFEFKNELDVHSTRLHWQQHLSKAAQSDNEFINHEYRRVTQELPRFKKSYDKIRRICVKDTRFHDVYISALKLFPNARFIYIVRHPGACISSWFNCKEFPREADWETEWRSGRQRKLEGPGEYWGFNDWIELTRKYIELMKQEPSRVLIVRYEELVHHTVENLQKMFAFLGIGMRPEPVEFVESSRSKWNESPYSVFRAGLNPNAWKGRIDPDILREITRKVENTNLEIFLTDVE